MSIIRELYATRLSTDMPFDRTKDTAQVLRIGIISDTHGLLRPEAEQRLAGVAHIIHAGDVGRADVLAGLREGDRHVQIGERDLQVPRPALVAEV